MVFVRAAESFKMKCPTKAQPPPSINMQVRETLLNGNGTLGRNDNYYQLKLFKKSAKIWIKDPELVWTGAELLQDFSFNTSSILVKRLSDSEEFEYNIVQCGLPFLCNPEILLGRDDLTHLSYLHEPAVLNNLQYRFRFEKIYTYSGVALVALNPYSDCSQLYGEDVISIYRGQGSKVRNLIPHVYAVAEESFYDLKEYGNNQSIIVSGESGAGKTVNSKFVMKYLTHITSSGTYLSKNGIESRVLASNPVMESIGNAKTMRNDNSSRFGKFIQINFNDRRAIHGAEMKTYLLEKSRVIVQSDDERNYHIFYQMCAYNNHPLLGDFNLGNADEYYYTNQGAISIDGVDDKEEFARTVHALTQLQISEAEQQQVFQVIAGLLLLGNIKFASHGEHSKIDAASDKWLEQFCSNYSVEVDDIRNWLCKREMRAGSELIDKRLSVDEAIANRDAMAKLIYSTIFNWIVRKINENLASTSKTQDKSSFIGVLDIYGFESYENGQNSFEQFCINYANENLQQTFNRHVFKLEQAEYRKEEISFEAIQFYDNEQCIDLISNLISLLDEQCKTGRGCDSDWLVQIETLKGYEHLQMPKIRSTTFIVKHYASDVCYNVDGFVKKNQDVVNEKLLETIADRTQFKFMRELMSPVLASLSAGNKRKKTVGVQFRESLNGLTAVINTTRPHYIRCIKPNDRKKSFCFEPKRVIDQLRACGVIETVRITATGYPTRWTYSEFYTRYRVLFAHQRDLEPKEFSKVVCDKFLSADTFALGKTKIFLKVGEIGKLESIRQETLYKSAVKIQTCYRGFIQRRRYQQILRRHHAAISLQAQIRGFIQWRKYQRLRSIALSIQSRFRASVVRKRVMQMRYERSAIVIQRCVRGYLVRRTRIKYIRKVTIVQACVRRWLAKRELRQLKVEAKSVNHLQNLNKDLANKVIELKGRLNVITHERDQLSDSMAVVETKLVKTLSTLETLQQQLRQTTEQFNGLNSKHEQLILDYNELQYSTAATADDLTKENDQLLKEVKEKAQQIELLQEQLVKNADLLVSPDFRADTLCSITLNRSNSNLSSGEMQLLMEQQAAITDLRQKLDRLTRLNERLQSENNARQLNDSPSFKNHDLMRIQNLEVLVNRYKTEIEGFASAAANGDGLDQSFLEYYKRLQDENERIQDENLGLRSLLTGMFEKKSSSVRDSGLWSANSSDDGLSPLTSTELDDHLSNDRILRQYRIALSLANQTIKNRDEQLAQLEDLRRPANDDENLPLEEEQTITDLVGQNLVLQKRLNRVSDDLSMAQSYLTGNSSSLSDHLNDDQSNEVLKLESLPTDGLSHYGLLEIFNVPEFARSLIYDLKPRLALRLSPCLPAYLLLAAFRYFDHAHNEMLISNLSNAVFVILKDISTNFKSDFDIQALWLVNVWRLLNLLRQYEGRAENEWVAQNTEKQNDLRMMNFNFEPIRNQLKLRVDDLYQNFMKCTVEPVLTPKISPGILHHESTPISNGKVHGKLSRESSKEVPAKSLDDIKEFLSIAYTKLTAFGADEVIIGHVFGQIAQWICSLSMNRLVFSKDLCSFEKAIQIKHNVSEIMTWYEKQRLRSVLFEPLIQACNLMMSQKNESNLEVLAGEMTSKLTTKQITSILTTYEPAKGFEEDPISSDFIAKFSKRLEQRASLANDSAIMPGTFLIPFETQKFVYSSEDVQQLTLPSCLKLDSISRLV